MRLLAAQLFFFMHALLQCLCRQAGCALVSMQTQPAEALPVRARSVPLTSGEHETSCALRSRTFWSYDVPVLHWEILPIIFVVC